MRVDLEAEGEQKKNMGNTGREESSSALYYYLTLDATYYSLSIESHHQARLKYRMEFNM